MIESTKNFFTGIKKHLLWIMGGIAFLTFVLATATNFMVSSNELLSGFSNLRVTWCRVVGRGCLAPPPDALNFKISYSYRHNVEQHFSPFSQGSTLHSGDHYKLIIQPLTDSYLYLLQADATHRGVRLFPSEVFAGAAAENRNPIQSGVIYFIPAQSQSFQLDQQIGTETIYLVALREKDVILESEYQQLFLSADDQVLRVSLVQTSGVVQEQQYPIVYPGEATDIAPTTVTWHERGQTFATSLHPVRGICVGCAYRVSFEHQ